MTKRVTSRVSRRPHPLPTKGKTSEPGGGPHEATSLHEALDNLTQLVKQFPLAGDSLRDAILSAGHELESRASAEFVAPIKDRQEFNARLARLVCAQKQARFNEDMRDAAAHLLAYLKTAEREDTVEYWRAHTLLYELNDIFHLDPSLKVKAEREGKRVYGELQVLSVNWEEEEITRERRRVIREKVRYCACRGNELKRSGQPEDALRLFDWLFQFTKGKLRDEDTFPCHGTLATLSYHLGSVYRILEQHNLAEDMYTQTLELLYEKAGRHGKGDPDDHLLIIRRQAMAIGIGFGWVNLTRGFLRRAENALATARSLLASSSDPVVPSYIELLYGTIKRCRAGRDPGRLAKALDSLNQARAEFEASGHRRYVARACWELCLTYILMGDYGAAKERLEVVAAHTAETGHPKWRTNVSIGRSRILRGERDFRGALKEADLATKWADGCTSILPKVDAYITLGEARFYATQEAAQPDANYPRARAAFEEALRIALEQDGAGGAKALPSNPKIAAVCNLRIAQCHAREGAEAKAKECFARWEMLRSSVEHEWVRELAGDVEREIAGLSKNFTIRADDEGEWNYAENVARLRQWLLERALRHSKRNYTKAADLLGVKRATLYQWQGDPGAQPKRARISDGDQRVQGKGKKN